jgi:mRNA interferase RelE/StbE
LGVYELRFHVDALGEWRQLDAGVRNRLKKKLLKRLENPLLESARLSGELSGLFVIRSQAEGLRLIYEVDEVEPKKYEPHV